MWAIETAKSPVLGMSGRRVVRLPLPPVEGADACTTAREPIPGGAVLWELRRLLAAIGLNLAAGNVESTRLNAAAPLEVSGSFRQTCWTLRRLLRTNLRVRARRPRSSFKQDIVAASIFGRLPRDQPTLVASVGANSL